MLLNEVFELRGMFKWLRRTLMVFVKVSYGRSINRYVVRVYLDCGLNLLTMPMGIMQCNILMLLELHNLV